MAVAAGLMLPALVGCLVSATAQAQAMECCEQSTCARGHQKQTCFSTTAPTGSSQSTPELHASLMAPSFATDVATPTKPEALLIVATPVLEELHVTVVVMSWVVLSE